MSRGMAKRRPVSLSERRRLRSSSSCMATSDLGHTAAAEEDGQRLRDLTGAFRDFVHLAEQGHGEFPGAVDGHRAGPEDHGVLEGVKGGELPDRDRCYPEPASAVERSRHADEPFYIGGDRFVGKRGLLAEEGREFPFL